MPLGNYKWVQCRADGPMPITDMIDSGRDIDNSPIYVGRAQHESDTIPAKVIPSKKIAYISYNGREHAKHQFEVLCRSHPSWVFCRGGDVPPHAVEGGRTSNGELLYVGRVLHQGSQTIGKVHPSHRCVYIPFGGEELSFPDYEVLVIN